MTVVTASMKVQYAGNGSTAIFPFSFPFIAKSHIRVYIDDELQTLNVHYTLTDPPADSGTVTFFSTPPNDYRPQTGETLTIVRSGETIDQTSFNPTPGGGLSTASIAAAMDAAARQRQQIAEQVARAPQLKPSTTLDAVTLPDPAANAYIRWNSDADDLEGVQMVETGTLTLPGASTDHAIPRFDGANGNTLLNSGVTIDDGDNVSGIVNLTQTGYHDLTEIAEPSNPSSGIARLYARTKLSRTELAYRNGAGQVTDLLRGVISARDFGAVGSGLVDDSEAINAALLYASDNSIASVRLPGSTYLVAAEPIFMRPRVQLIGEGYHSRLRQADGADLHAVVDFSSYFGGVTATGATLRNLSVDGNRANNPSALGTGDDLTRLVYYGNTDDVSIIDCDLRNGPGYGIHGSNQHGLRVFRNRLTNIEKHAFFCVYIPGNYDADLMFCDNYSDNHILIYGVNGILVRGNIIRGALIGGVDDPMVVDISGDTVTWVSGPNFSTAKTGQVIIADTGSEQSFIKEIVSNTELKTENTLGTKNDVLAIIGEDDLLGVAGCKNGVVSDNLLFNGASFGLSLAGGENTKLENIIFSNNFMYRQGKNGFACLGHYGNGSGIGAQNITIMGNHVVNCNQGGEAGNDATGSGPTSYLIVGDGGSDEDNIMLEGNFAQDDTGLTTYWLGLSGLDNGTVKVGTGNHQIGAQNPGVYGGIASVVPGAGWGSTAAVSNIRSDGHSAFFVITPGGTGIAANPVCAVNVVAGKMTQGNSAGSNPTYDAKMVSGTGTISHLYDDHFSTPTSIVFRYLGTPVSGNTYSIQIT